MIFQSDLLAGRTALVTGGGTGICRGIALALAAHAVAPGPTAGTEGARRLAGIDGVASAALFLCSAGAPFITGMTLVVDGGLSLRSASVLSPATS